MTATLHFTYYHKGTSKEGIQTVLLPTCRGWRLDKCSSLGSASSLQSCPLFSPACYIWSPLGRCWRQLRLEQPQKALSSSRSSWTNRKASSSQSINWWDNLKLWETHSRGKENVYKWCAVIARYIPPPRFLHPCYFPPLSVFFSYYFVFFYNLSEAKCGNVCSKCMTMMGWAEPTFHHMQLITVYSQCILSEHPDEPKSLPYSHSVKMASLRPHECTDCQLRPH